MLVVCNKHRRQTAVLVVCNKHRRQTAVLLVVCNKHRGQTAVLLVVCNKHCSHLQALCRYKYREAAQVGSQRGLHVSELHLASTNL